MKPEKPKRAKTTAKRTGKGAARLSPAKDLGKASASATPGQGSREQKRAAGSNISSTQSAPKSPLIPSPPKLKSVAPKKPRAALAKKTLAVPPILLEGDAPPAPRPSGPGERYVAASPEVLPSGREEAELPEAYGTQRLLLVARDPHWVYAHWDMTTDQLRAHNTESRDGHLILRVFREQAGGELVLEQHVHPESRNWFLHVGRGGTKYVAQLGCYTRAGDWKAVVTSGATLTPPDVVAEDVSVRFETIPVEVPFSKLIEVVKEAVAEHVPLVQAIQALRQEGHVELPAFAPSEAQHLPGPALTESEAVQIREMIAFAAPSRPQWTPEQERALAQVINIDDVRRVWMGSLEITELIRRKLENELASQAAADLTGAGERGEEEVGGVSSISSPFGGEERRKGFWFNINAELIIYGRTEPAATVTIGGRKIQLRRDGSFSFRFALPDGTYDLPVQAISPDGDDTRLAQLSFRRATEYRGEVAQHPQDESLRSPQVENVA